MSARELILSPRARIELKRIGRYTEKTWGVAQRNRYLLLLSDEIEKIRARPQRGRIHPDLGGNIWYLRVHMHYVFYIFDDERTEIAAILHTRMNPKLHF
jgi:toxin ParE1/3/4